MSENTRQPREPTVDDLRVKTCYICLEEEHHDSPPDPPPVWTHPCKCTLIAHESSLLHWISTQQRDFGRSRNQVKCPQCREFFELVDYSPTVLRVLNFVHRALSRTDRIATWFYVPATVILFGAGVYLACATYGAFAVREFLGPDMFNTLLSANPTLWPRHAWVNLPLIPFSLITMCTPFLWTTPSHSLVPLVVWITSFVPILSPWPTSPPVVPHVALSSDALPPVHPASLRMWPPPPVLVWALFPCVRMVYEHLRTRVTWALVHGQVPERQQLRQVAGQEQPRWGDNQEQRLRLQQEQEQRQQEQPRLRDSQERLQQLLRQQEQQQEEEQEEEQLERQRYQQLEQRQRQQAQPRWRGLQGLLRRRRQRQQEEQEDRQRQRQQQQQRQVVRQEQPLWRDHQERLQQLRRQQEQRQQQQQQAQQQQQQAQQVQQQRQEQPNHNNFGA